jgi:hypothetical protein
VGFLKHLLFWPVTGPMYLAEFSLEKVHGVVKEQLTDDARIKEELLDLQLRLEMGDIDDDQFMVEEARLMDQLREIRRWREEFGMATRGGLVQVAEDAKADAKAEAEAEAAKEQPPRALTGKAEMDISVDLGWDEEK